MSETEFKSVEFGNPIPTGQTDREIAEMIAKFRTPPGFSWRDLANDIETVLKTRPRSAAPADPIAPLPRRHPLYGRGLTRRQICDAGCQGWGKYFGLANTEMPCLACEETGLRRGDH
jgi:hypothetical protein